MPDNGKFADADLAAIPGGHLAKEAAANWLALRAKGGKELGIWICPLGPRSSYRTFAEQQQFWDLYQRGGNLAARPGTSNHGFGNAVDLAHPPTMRRIVDSFGGPFGWHWGEAPSESWHVTYRGGGSADVKSLTVDEHPSLKEGDSGEAVTRVQKWLAEHGAKGISVDGQYGEKTAQTVADLYRAWGHAGHGRFGDVGWSIIEGKHPWRVLRDDEREALAKLFRARRVAKRKGGWKQVKVRTRENAIVQLAFLIDRRRDLWAKGKAEGWKDNRRRRYQIIKQVTTDGAGP